MRRSRPRCGRPARSCPRRSRRGNGARQRRPRHRRHGPGGSLEDRRLWSRQRRGSSNRKEATPAPARWSASTANRRKPAMSESLSWSPLPLTRTTAGCGPSPSGNVNSPARTMSPLEKTTSSRRNAAPSPSAAGGILEALQPEGLRHAGLGELALDHAVAHFPRPRWRARWASSTRSGCGSHRAQRSTGASRHTPWMLIVARRTSPDTVMSTAKGRAVGPGMEISPSPAPLQLRIPDSGLVGFIWRVGFRRSGRLRRLTRRGRGVHRLGGLGGRGRTGDSLLRSLRSTCFRRRERSGYGCRGRNVLTAARRGGNQQQDDDRRKKPRLSRSRHQTSPVNGAAGRR